MRFFVGSRRASFFISIGVFPFLFGSGIAKAEVVQKTPQGFVVRSSVEVGASPEAVWSTLSAPSGWWSPEHSFSGSAANFTLDLVPGGCFCEKLPAQAAAKAGKSGGVAHMRVVYFEPVRVLRMTGALGPLQSEAVNGVWTITLKSDVALKSPGNLKNADGRTRILFEYVVGGFMRYTSDQIAPVVDKVLTGQLLRLAAKVDPTVRPSLVEGEALVDPVRRPAVGSTSNAEKSSTAVKVEAVPAPAQVEKDSRDLSSEDELGVGGADNGSASVSKLVADLDAVMSRSPPATRSTSVTQKSTAYVYREAVVRKSGRDFMLVDDTSDQPPLMLVFGSPSSEARFRKEFMELSGSGSAIICQCTGRIADNGRSPSFHAIDAKLIAG